MCQCECTNFVNISTGQGMYWLICRPVIRMRVLINHLFCLTLSHKHQKSPFSPYNFSIIRRFRKWQFFSIGSLIFVAYACAKRTKKNTDNLLFYAHFSTNSWNTFICSIFAPILLLRKNNFFFSFRVFFVSGFRRIEYIFVLFLKFG